MTKYRNPQKELEMQEVEELEREENLLKEPAGTAEEEVWKKRYADQQRYLNQVKNENKSRIDDLERKLDQALKGQIKAPKTDEDVEQWMSQYPEFAGILETILQKRIREATSTTDQKLTAIEHRQKELDYKEAVIELRRLHPDLDKLLGKDSDFRKWLEKQPQKYKDKMNSLDVDEASLVINVYKSQKKSTKSKVDDDDFFVNDAAKVVRPSAIVEPDADAGDYEFTESQIERESRRDRRWYDRNEEKIMDAHRRGKVLYDLSGGAR